MNDHVAVIAARLEHLLHNLFVIHGGCARKQIVGESELGQILYDDAIVFIGELLGSDPFFLSCHEDRRSVLISAGHHEHIFAAHSHIAGEDVRGNTESGNVADVARAIGVWPSNCRENMRHSHRILAPASAGILARLTPHRNSPISVKVGGIGRSSRARGSLRLGDARRFLATTKGPAEAGP